MRKIGVFTTTRAEFGILSALIHEVERNNLIDYDLFVGGSHLKQEHGYTIEEVHKFNFKISDTFNYLLDGDDESVVAQSLSIAVKKISNIFKNHDFDFTIVLGDRIELLTIILNSILFKVPIIHIHGGERSEGSTDEQIRHMITKSAHIHFASCAEYSDNIRRMGESDWRIFNTGALSIDNIVNLPKIERTTLLNGLGLKTDKPVIIATYHPVSLEFGIDTLAQIKNIFKALDKYDFQVIFTAPGMEIDRVEIESYIHQKIDQKENYFYYKSLGVQKYYSLLPHCAFIIGNSSSGINEVPFFRIPTVNIGSRQKGRIKHVSVIDTDYSVDSIVSGIEKALSLKFLEQIKKQKFRFGNGNAAKKMVEIIKELKIDGKLLSKKLDFPVLAH